MQKSLSELVSLSNDELSGLIAGINLPLRVTQHGEPQFVAQSLPAFEEMVRRLRFLEAERKRDALAKDRPPRRGQLIPLRP